MDTFRWISVAFSMILGLGVTRILSGAILVFRSRRRATLDWIPLAWAFSTFVLQLQFWWAVIELARVERVWTLFDFLTMIAVPLLLFAAAALVLPAEELEAGERLDDEFQHDGRFGVLCLSAYAAVALFADWRIFGAGLVSAPTAVLAAEILLPLVFVVHSGRGARAMATALYVLLVLSSSLFLSPRAY
ncbi:MAG: hypothetical protein IPK00_14195 [Deltaproteobacteria bacterium]|nr:hypothetical protein [Deltaproteobacteria bacterium]